MAKSAPAVPDPYQTADAQAKANLAAIKESAKINSLDQYAPWGSTTYTRNGEGIPTAQNIQLGAAEQQNYDTVSAAKNLMATNAQNLAGYLTNAPFTMPDSAASQDAVANALYQRKLAQLLPQLAEADNMANVNLTNRGIPIGSEIYNTEMNRLAQNKNDLFASLAQDSTLAAGAEQDRQLQDALAIRNQGYNELASLLSGAAGMQMPTFQNPPAYMVKPPNLEGDVYQAAQIQAQQAAAQNQMLNGLFGLFTSFIPKSDRRVKQEIRRVGTTDGGIPVYTFRYKSGGPIQMGVMADEVEKVVPEAVVTIAGVKHVDYSRIG